VPLAYQVKGERKGKQIMEKKMQRMRKINQQLKTE
jgi:hypothetical protein